MNCRAARRAMVERLSDPAIHDDDLDVHLKTCARCRERLEQFRAVRRGMRELQGVSVPESVIEKLDRRVEEALGAGPDRDLVPASPDPESSLLFRALVFVGVMLLVGGVMAGALALLPRTGEPVKPVADLIGMVGDVRFQIGEDRNWQRLEGGQPLWPGTTLRTAPAALARVCTDGAHWHLDSGSALGFGEPGLVEPVLGRVYVDCDRPPGEPLRLLSRQGTVECIRGRLVLNPTPNRLRVACVAGEARLVTEEESRLLEAGRCAMLREGSVWGPVRPVYIPEAIQWLRKFPDAEGRRLTARQLASVRVSPSSGALPPSVEVADLDLELTVCGSLAVVFLRGTLRNSGETDWEGELAAGDLILPAPLAEVAAPVSVPAGGTAEFHAGAVCALHYREGRGALGINPRCWTGAVRRATVRVDASVPGGFRTAVCPLQGLSARWEEQVSWEYSETGPAAAEPMVFEFQPARPHGVDVLAADDALLIGWRPPRRKHDWLSRDTRLLVALDATADFGPGGRCHAQEVMEKVLGALPMGCRTALAAYDGSLKVERSPMSRHTPPRVEAMLAGIWRLEADPQANEGGFAETALKLAGLAESGRMLLYVTGRGAPSELERDAVRGAVEGGVRVLVLQVGAPAADPVWRQVCAATGGAAMGVPAGMAPGLAAGDFLAALSRPPMAELVLDLSAEEEIVAPASGRFALQPVVALAWPLPKGASAGSFRATAGGRVLEQEFSFEAPRPALTGPMARRLVERLRAALARM